MTGCAVLLVHDEVPGRGSAVVGSLPAALTGLDLDPVVSTFGSDGPRPPEPRAARLIVVLGSAEAADDDSLLWLAPERDYLTEAITLGVPVLGICFGAQLLARQLGGTVGRAPRSERGFVALRSTDPGLVPDGVWMQFHDDTFTLPPGAELLAANEVGPQAFRHGRCLGVQFHPEIGPAAFAAWVDGWRASGTLAGISGQVDLPGLAAEVQAHADRSAAACRDLVLRAFGER